MRWVICATLLNLGLCFNAAQLADLVDEHWRAQASGDASTFVSQLAPGYTQIVNGEVDNAPWTNVEYVKNYFARVTVSSLHALSGVILAGPNTVIVVADWQVKFQDTLDVLRMGEWQQTYTFNDAGKLTKLSSICDGAQVQKLSDLLSTEPVDYKPAFQGLINAFNAKDVRGVMDTFAPEGLVWLRNGQNDSFTWPRPRFLGFLFQQTLSVTLDNFASSIPRTSYAALTWTHTAKQDQKVTVLPDSWFITWNPDGKISHVRSVTNGGEAILYAHVIPAVMESLSPQNKEELKSLYQAGDLSLKQLHQRLDL